MGIGYEGLSGQAYRKRYNDLVTNPTPEMIEEAKAHAHDLTFTNVPSEFVQKSMDLLNHFPVVRYLAPFVGTPSQILARINEFGPMTGALSKEYRDAYLKGGEARRHMRARTAVGTTLLLTGMKLRDEGIISTGHYENTNYKYKYSQLEPEFGFYVGTDDAGNPQYFDLRRNGGPMGVVLLAGAIANDFLSGAQTQQEMDDAIEVTQMLGAMLGMIAEDAWLPDTLNIVDDMINGRAGPVEQWALRTAQGWVPYSSLMREFDRKYHGGLDLRPKASGGAGGKDESFTEQLFEMLEQTKLHYGRRAFWSSPDRNTYPDLDIYGEPKRHFNPPAPEGQNYSASPMGYLSGSAWLYGRKDPLSKEILELKPNVGKRVSPTSVSSFRGFSDVIEYTPEEHHWINQKLGRTFFERATEMVNDATFQEIEVPAIKRDLLTKVYNDSKKLAIRLAELGDPENPDNTQFPELVARKQQSMTRARLKFFSFGQQQQQTQLEPR